MKVQRVKPHWRGVSRQLIVSFQLFNLFDGPEIAELLEDEDIFSSHPAYVRSPVAQRVFRGCGRNETEGSSARSSTPKWPQRLDESARRCVLPRGGSRMPDELLR